jgi:hypothetical protein
VVKQRLAQPLHLGLGRSDRDGAFTTTWGVRRALFDEEADKVLLERHFGSKDSPRTATTKLERFWRTLCAATDAVILASGIGQCYSFYAMCFAVHVYSRSQIAANMFEPGAAPYITLRLKVGLQRLVPFWNKCALALKPTSNGHAAHRTGRIIGYLVDTPGYIALLEPFPDKPFRPPRIVASMDVVPLPVRRPWVERTNSTPAGRKTARMANS